MPRYGNHSTTLFSNVNHHHPLIECAFFQFLLFSTTNLLCPSLFMRTTRMNKLFMNSAALHYFSVRTSYGRTKIDTRAADVEHTYETGAKTEWKIKLISRFCKRHFATALPMKSSSGRRSQDNRCANKLTMRARQRRRTTDRKRILINFHCHRTRVRVCEHCMCAKYWEWLWMRLRALLCAITRRQNELT